MFMTDRVSIILPTYNRGYCIGKSIDSVLAQTYPHFELLIMDDGSTDNTGEIVEEYAQRDTRVKYHKLEQNRGASAARNEGIRLAACEYIAFEDSDDLWKKDKLEKQMNALEVHKKDAVWGMVYCAYAGVKSDNIIHIMPERTLDTQYLEGDIYGLLLMRNVIGGPTAIIKKECLEKCGGFDEELSALEDWELFLRIARDYLVAYVDEPLLTADIHEGGVSSKVGGYFHARCVMLAKHKKELLEMGLFNAVVQEILVKAKETGVLEQVGKMMEQVLG